MITPEVATGADTAEGLQVRGFTAVNGFDVLRAGVHHVHVACVGNGSLTVTTRLAAGTATAPLPASSTSGQATRLVLDCTPEGAVSTTDFSLVDGDPGVELGVLPAAGTVAVAGYAIS